MGALAPYMFCMKQCNNSLSYEVFSKIINVLESNKYITYCKHRNSQHLHVKQACHIQSTAIQQSPCINVFETTFPLVYQNISNKKQRCSCQCARWRCANKKNIVGRVKGMCCHATSRCNIPVTLLLLKPQILLKKPNHFKANTQSAETMSIPSKLTTVIMLLICAQMMSGFEQRCKHKILPSDNFHCRSQLLHSIQFKFIISTNHAVIQCRPVRVTINKHNTINISQYSSNCYVSTTVITGLYPKHALTVPGSGSQLLAMEAGVQSSYGSCGINGEHRCTGICFSPYASVFPSQYHSTNQTF